MRLEAYIDSAAKALVFSASSSEVLQPRTLFRDDTLNLGVTLLKQNPEAGRFAADPYLVEDITALSLRVGIGDLSKPEGERLVTLQGTWTRDLVGMRFEGALALDTAEVRALFLYEAGNSLRLTLEVEVWEGGTPTTVLQVPVILARDLINAGEAEPSEWEDASALADAMAGLLPNTATITWLRDGNHILCNVVDVPPGIDAARIGAGNISNAEYNHLNNLTGNIQSQLDGKQALDADLTAIAGLSSTGVMVRTGTGTAVTRSMATGSSKLSLSNASGVAGDPTYDVVEANLTLSNLGGAVTTGQLPSGIDAAKIADGSVSSAEFQRLDGVASGIQGQIDGKQPLDSDLTAIAGLSSTGYIVRTGTGTMAARSITVGSSKLSLSNGDGVAGNTALDVVEANLTLSNIGGAVTTGQLPSGIDAAKVADGSVGNAEFQRLDGVTSGIQSQIDGKQPLDSDLTAIAGLSATGYIVRTGTGTMSARSITVGSSKLSLSNGDGVAGNTALDVVEANLTLSNIGGAVTTGQLPSGIDAAKIADGSVSNAEFQRLDGVTSGIQGQIDGKQALDSDLTAIAGLSGTGLLARTGTGTMETRAITAGAGISVTNGDGVAGNPTIALTSVPTGVVVLSIDVDATVADTYPVFTAGADFVVLAMETLVRDSDGVLDTPVVQLIRDSDPSNPYVSDQLDGGDGSMPEGFWQSFEVTSLHLLNPLIESGAECQFVVVTPADATTCDLTVFVRGYYI